MGIGPKFDKYLATWLTCVVCTIHQMKINPSDRITKRKRFTAKVIPTRSSIFSSDTDDIQSISSEDEESRKKAKDFEKKSLSSIKTQCKKIPRGHGPKDLGQEDEEYNEEGEDMNTNEEEEKNQGGGSG